MKGMDLTYRLLQKDTNLFTDAVMIALMNTVMGRPQLSLTTCCLSEQLLNTGHVKGSTMQKSWHD